ncbi:HpcH/HpaI aldolase/citrate lyase family protein [Amycolatopsis arida]|uniref:HpcH/HpaI aldolase/citrate lyase family protein n=1 Tax=Amycolatopsis arida TaxID=587909 RepID=A0A1I5KEX0_9PSEU|nr:aldolase/citrate lyase family protein [Amycolatopsis arida]TDX97016.1 HpcH/HpaI aldolase/citrate lyase family protein [Amycolatopsis arida]SFO83642.1 HpcH/HpaI aldolase/citrate lyase family protein [Amycolatopsis arida]
MTNRLPEEVYARVDARLAAADARVAATYPGEPVGRQPVHTVYVPADRFSAGLVEEWGARARAVEEEHGAALEMTPDVAERVRAKLRAEPIEDLRIDFEDGYGHRRDAEEDATAAGAARAVAELVAAGTAPPFVGIRFKSLERATRRRGLRTLDLFLGTVLESGGLPRGFVVTLPKVTAVEQVEAAVEVLAELESAHRLPAGTLRFEVQVETPQSVLDADGTVAVPRIVAAAAGRCAGLHYGTYDYSAGLGISAAYQSMDHPAADFARQVMLLAAAGRGVRVSDGSTNRLPVGDSAVIAAAWAEHQRLIRRSLAHGLYQGWDLHPHQLPSRFAATYAFFREGFAAAADRLRAYVASTAGAGSDSAVLDEPATAQALARYLCRGLDCGALTEAEMATASDLNRSGLDRLARRED